MVCEKPRVVRRKSKSEALYRSHTESALLGKIFHSLLAVSFVKQTLSEKSCGGKVHLVNAFSRNAPLRVTVAVLGKGYTRPLSQNTKRVYVIKIFHLHREGDNVAARAATEAIKALGGGKDRKRRRFLTVERAQPVKIRARPLKRNVRAYHLLYIASENYFIYYFSRYHR